MKPQEVVAEAPCSQPCRPSDYLESLENPGTSDLSCGLWQRDCVGVTCHLSLVPEHSLSRGREDCDMRRSLLQL